MTRSKNIGTSDNVLLGLSQSGSRRNTHVITEAIAENDDRGKLGFEVPALNDGGTCYECTKGEKGHKTDRFHLGGEKVGACR